MKLIDITILTNIKGLGSANMAKILNYCESHNIKSQTKHEFRYRKFY